MIYRRIICALLFSQGLQLNAQDELDQFLQAGVNDASNLISNYLEPVFQGIGYGYSNGWYNTAKPHETLGFDISISANVAFVPNSSLTFTFDESQYDNIRLSDPSDNQLPTVLGPYEKEERPDLTFYNNGEEVVRITAPPGAIAMKEEVGFNAIPVPMVQAGIGVYKGTDVILRFVPGLSFADDKVRISMFGYGIKHNIGQWFKVLDYAGLDVSVLAGVSTMKITGDLSDEDDPVTANNEGIFKINGFVLQGIVSKEYVNIFTIYGAVGYSRAGSRTRILGTYPIDEEFEQLPEDPIDWKYANSSMNMTAGLRVRLVAVTLSSAFTLQKYPVLSMGVGVTIR